jgi:hypothetical protein
MLLRVVRRIRDETGMSLFVGENLEAFGHAKRAAKKHHLDPIRKVVANFFPPVP